MAHGNNTWFPAWQFEGPTVRAELPEILKLLTRFTSYPRRGRPDHADQALEELAGASISTALHRRSQHPPRGRCSLPSAPSRRRLPGSPSGRPPGRPPHLFGACRNRDLACRSRPNRQHLPAHGFPVPLLPIRPRVGRISHSRGRPYLRGCFPRALSEHGSRHSRRPCEPVSSQARRRPTLKVFDLRTQKNQEMFLGRRRSDKRRPAAASVAEVPSAGRCRSNVVERPQDAIGDPVAGLHAADIC